MTGGDDKKPDLAEIRRQINEIDRRIQELINERASVAQDVARAKGESASAVDYFRPEREAVGGPSARHQECLRS